MSNVLEVQGLKKVIDGEKILDNISFCVPKGKLCAFIGHNGAGKTTTIKSILSLYRYDSGTILIDGINSKKISSHRVLGYVPEKENFPKIRAKVFLQMMASLYDMPRNITKSKIKYYEHIFGLKNRLNINLSSMSSGQKKKIMIIQSLLHDPQLLIMDEPTENLDPDTRDIFYRLMNKLKKQGRTIFISTHNLDEIQNFADWIVIIINGKIKKVSDHVPSQDLHRIYNRYKPKIVV
jgi:ABC-2 type transport system ATP-binding protein